MYQKTYTADLSESACAGSEWSGHTGYNHISDFIQNMHILGTESQPLTVYDGPLKNPSLFPFNPPTSQ